MNRAEFCLQPEFAKRTRFVTTAMRRGIAFEKKVLKGYCESPLFLPKPWLRRDGAYHQPDGMFFDFARGRVMLIEVKYSHCAEAAEQLNRYKGLLVDLFPPSLWDIYRVEVVKNFDPFVRFPTQIHLIGSFADVRSDVINVLRH